MSFYLGTEPVPQAILRKESTTLTAGQSVISTGGYSNGDLIQVSLNGVIIEGSGVDYTASNGSDITLTVAGNAGDVLQFQTFDAFELVGSKFSAPTITNDVTLKNNTEEDTDGGRSSKLVYKGEQSGGQESTLAEIQASHDGSANDQKGDLIFKTNDGSDNAVPTEAMRIDSVQKVGIGVAPVRRLHIGGTGSDQGELHLTNATTGHTQTDGSTFTTSGSDLLILQRENADIAISTNGSERMRVDSSGNVLIGKTSTSFSTAGSRLVSNGRGQFVVDGGAPIEMNRLSSDGTMILFQKDGTTVGDIGASGGRLHIGSTEGDDCFIGFGNSIVRPTNSAGSSRDANTDLGYTGMRFKDLYLSGGVYLGGTGAANKLDEYEEGVYQYTLTGSTSGSENIRSGYAYFNYTRIGRLVKVMGRFELLSSSGAVGSLRFSLPFTQVSNLADQADTGIGTVTFFRTGLSGMETVLRGVVYPGSDKLVAIRQTGSGSEQQISGANVDANYEGYLECTMLVD